MSYEHASTSVGTIETGLSVCRNGYSTFFGINPHIFMSQRRSPAPKLCHAPVTRTVTGTSIANGYGTLVVEGKKNDEAPQAPTRTAPQAQCPSYHEVCHRKRLRATSRGAGREAVRRAAHHSGPASGALPLLEGPASVAPTTLGVLLVLY